MGIVITQSPEQFRNALELTRRLEMINVSLRSSTVSCNPECLEALESESLNVGMTYTADELRISNDRLTANIKFELAVFRPAQSGDDEVLIQIEAVFSASYSMDGDFEASPEQKKAFHESNVVFNCWPFFREYAQSTAVRMSYPPPPIPFLRMNIGDSDQQPEELGK